MPNYGFTREQMLEELKRRGVDVSQFSAPVAPQDTPMAPLTPGSDARPRIAMGFGPAVDAQRQMYKSERWGQPGTASPLGRNPLNDHPIATNLALSAETGKPTILGFDKQAIAKTIGGNDYQEYDQAAKTWEASILPVLSGAAITPSEAQRQLRANLPQLGDSPQILARKAKNRAMMTNAAADFIGRPRPFPKVGTWDFQGGAVPSAPAPGAGGPVRVNTPEEAMALPKGTVFMTPDGRRKVR